MLFSFSRRNEERAVVRNAIFSNKKNSLIKRIIILRARNMNPLLSDIVSKIINYASIDN